MKYLIASLMLVNVTVFSQTQDIKSAFVSFIGGGTITELQDFDKVYDSKYGISYGLGLGLPLSTKLFIYGKATYFSKSGVPVVYTLNYDPPSHSWIKSNERKDGTASYKQWFFNAGLVYKFELSEEYNISVVGGATITKINEVKNNLNGTVSSNAVGLGFLGYFGGVGVEKRFLDTPLSIVAEMQQNFSRKSILNLHGNYGATNLNLGLRYYFNDRRNQ
jgi:hypothetical protein